MAQIRVLIVDDSALVRSILTQILSSDPEICVVGSAPDPLVAREKVKELNPDVLTLDVEMPRMDGITFLSNLMRLRPMPVVMISSLTERSADVTLHALDLGAVDFVTKPKVGISSELAEYRDEIIGKIKAAARVSNPGALAKRAPAKSNGKSRPAARAKSGYKTTDLLLAIGASTGGTEAIRQVLQCLPPDSPGVVIAQHIPEAFSSAFARRLDGASAISVREARDGAPVISGHAYVAPGDDHLRVEKDGARWVCRVAKGDVVNHHRPSVDVLFDSVARAAGANAIGVLLTGMGRDGAQGLLHMREAGARTLVQDEATSVVWGMPGAAWSLGAAEEAVAIDRIPDRVLSMVGEREA